MFFQRESTPDWAIRCLEKGFDSKSLRMLASMNEANSASELSEYMNRSLRELGWDEIEKQTYLMRRAEILAEEIVKDETEPIKASREIYQILINLDYPSRLHGWYEIDEMIWDYEHFVKTGEKYYFYRPKEELIDEIKKIAQELLESKERI